MTYFRACTPQVSAEGKYTRLRTFCVSGHGEFSAQRWVVDTRFCVTSMVQTEMSVETGRQGQMDTHTRHEKQARNYIYDREQHVGDPEAKCALAFKLHSESRVTNSTLRGNSHISEETAYMQVRYVHVHCELELLESIILLCLCLLLLFCDSKRIEVRNGHQVHNLMSKCEPRQGLVMPQQC